MWCKVITEPEDLRDMGTTHFFVVREVDMPSICVPLKTVRERCTLCGGRPLATWQPLNQDGGPGPACGECLNRRGFIIQPWDGEQGLATHLTQIDQEITCLHCKGPMREVEGPPNHRGPECHHYRCDPCCDAHKMPPQYSICFKIPRMRRTKSESTPIPVEDLTVAEVAKAHPMRKPGESDDDLRNRLIKKPEELN